MNIKTHYYNFGSIGIFARFMVMLRYALPYDIDEIYFDSTPDDSTTNPFDWVFDQYHNQTFISAEKVYKGIDHPNNVKLIEQSYDYEKLQLICSKIKIQKNILDWVEDKYIQFTGNCLGVHVRLGDMNHHHPEYGINTINDYISRINQILNEENIDKIFVTSDSYDSLAILDQYFGSKIFFFNDIIRAQEWDFQKHPMFDNINNRVFWEEAIKETLLLSKCDQLLCRVSNFANASILFSKTFKKIHRV